MLEDIARRLTRIIRLARIRSRPAPGQQQKREGASSTDVRLGKHVREGLLIHFAPEVATEEDCEAIAAFMIEKQAFASVDWTQVEPGGETAVLVDESGRTLSNMVWDDSGMVWGYKLSDRFWE